MSDSFDKKTEIQKLAHLLHTDSQSIEYFDKLSVENLKHINELLNNALLGDESPLWGRLAQVTKFIPNFINAKIAQDILGAQITANLTYHMSVKDAISIARHFSIPFLVDTAEKLIPQKAEKIVQEFPIDLIRKMIKEMLKKSMHYTMGSYVDFLPQQTILTLMKEIPDEEDILKTAVFAERKDRLADLFEEFDDQKIISFVHKAQQLNLWSELLIIVHYLSNTQLERIAYLTYQFTDEEILTMLKTGIVLQVSHNLLNITRYMSDDDLKRISAMFDTLTDSEVIGFAESAADDELWSALAKILESIDTKHNDRLRNIFSQLSQEKQAGLKKAATVYGQRLNYLWQ